MNINFGNFIWIGTGIVATGILYYVARWYVFNTSKMFDDDTDLSDESAEAKLRHIKNQREKRNDLEKIFKQVRMISIIVWVCITMTLLILDPVRYGGEQQDVGSEVSKQEARETVISTEEEVKTSNDTILKEDGKKIFDDLNTEIKTSEEEYEAFLKKAKGE
jgi:hypothetical protein